MFASQVFGIELSITQQIMVMLTIGLNAVNLLMETIGLLAGADRILNMARVIPNIVGDAAAAFYDYCKTTAPVKRF